MCATACHLRPSVSADRLNDYESPAVLNLNLYGSPISQWSSPTHVYRPYHVPHPTNNVHGQGHTGNSQETHQIDFISIWKGLSYSQAEELYSLEQDFVVALRTIFTQILEAQLVRAMPRNGMFVLPRLSLMIKPLNRPRWPSQRGGSPSICQCSRLW